MMEAPNEQTRLAGGFRLDGFEQVPGPLKPAIAKFLEIDRINHFYSHALEGGGGSGFERILAALDVRIRIDQTELRRVPARGPVVVVANHPFGMLEGLILGSLLGSIRPDVKIVANHMLRGLKELAGTFICVDPFGGREARATNLGPVRECIEHLDRDGLLVLFPAGEVSHLDLRSGAVTDPEWASSAARLIRRSRAAAVPVYFSGGNSLPFHLLGAIHPLLRTLRLPHELFRMRGREVGVRIGKPIPAAALEGQDETTATRYLRARSYLLGARESCRKASFHVTLPKWEQALAVQAGPEVLEREVAALPAEARLSETGEYEVLLVQAAQAPAMMREIGRLRELTFRGVGEGTGKRLDLDRYDAYYDHLVLWHRGRRVVAGGYRVASTLDVLPRFGVKGLYTDTLFRYRPGFFERLGPALELGRSFIHPDFQKSYAPLLALWRAIGAYVCRRPEHRILFGPVSISRDYSDASRRLMARTLAARCPLPELERLVEPRHPFAAQKPADGCGSLLAMDMEELSSLIADVEPDGKAVPVLLRQYLKLGGRVVGFNVDRKFSGVVDSLLVVDLPRAAPGLLERYLGKAGSAGFLEYQRK